MIARDEDGKYTAYAWPGGYPVYHITDDCESLCATCANDPGNPVHVNEPSDGWRIIESAVNWEDESMFCCHCNERIESAYGDEEEDAA